MKPLLIALLAFPGPLIKAQSARFGAHHSPGPRSGYAEAPSRGISPAGNPVPSVGAGMINPFYPGATTHAQRLGAAVSGYPGYILGPPGRPHGQPVLPVYAVGAPGWYGGYYAAPPSPPNVTVVQAPPPVVIYNREYVPEQARPVMREYATGSDGSSERVRAYEAPIPSHPEPQAQDMPKESKEAAIYLIALKDGAVVTAVASWKEDGSLHYITPRHAHKKVGLTLVDLKLTERLNRERGLAPPVQ